MEGVTRVNKTAQTQIDEIRSTAKISRTYIDFLVPRSGGFFQVLDPVGKQQLSEALKYKGTDASSLYRGLAIQLNSVFEGYIKLLVSAFVDHKCENAKTYNDLDEKLRTEHLISSAKVLTFIQSGTVNGVRHDFSQTQANLVACLSGAEKYSLNKDVFTILLGNCTPSRLEKLFYSIGLPPPFSDNLGSNKKLQAWAGDNSKRRVAEQAKEELEKQLDIRNEIVHGNVSKALSHNDFDEAADFFSSLIEGITELVTRTA